MRKYKLKQRDESTGIWNNVKVFRDYIKNTVDDKWFFGLIPYKKTVYKTIDLAELRKNIREEAFALFSGSGKDVKVEEYYRVCNNTEEGTYYSWEYSCVVWKNGKWLD